MTDKNHPLEELLDLDEGSTPKYDPLATITDVRDDKDEDNIFDILDTESEAASLTEADESDMYEVDDSLEKVMDSMPVPEKFYDQIDEKVRDKYNEVYGFGLSAYSRQMQEAELVEGKYKARNYEVAAQFLRISLDAAKDSGNQKANKDKLKLAEKKINHEVGAGKKGNTNNNYFIGDTNDLLKAIDDAKSSGKSARIINPDEDVD